MKILLSFLSFLFVFPSFGSGQITLQGMLTTDAGDPVPETRIVVSGAGGDETNGIGGDGRLEGGRFGLVEQEYRDGRRVDDHQPGNPRSS